MQDIRQSNIYAKYMENIGWRVDRIDNIQIFVKRLPIVGVFIKIQRPIKLPTEKFLTKINKKYKLLSISIEPKDKELKIKDFKVNDSPYLPTKTIHIDLTPSEEFIFKTFDESKRRAVRKAIKNGVVVKDSNTVEEFIKLKAKDFWPLHFFMAQDIKVLWENFKQKNASVLIAYHNANPIAGILLLLHDGIAYYWMAASNNEGKKLSAPTLLVWNALRLAKKKRSKIFDFEGIYDERFHNATKKWKGFTKFKQGFGGKEILFPKPLMRRYRAF